ncbi:uncharacterized protein LOC123319309 [Coccinella septempunctata]|uniref:uncharacterized protein LOC123319309 n=1 Tax=Coccinella septempunctata TaxID=41139 RepID=UPI001D080BA9|nr:uncharacterized protein LOC123319309 [Coccinella septempunctata]XP_044762141.1 uncharacterized protein LOC123319309 [Coccinella septempunctata]
MGKMKFCALFVIVFCFCCTSAAPSETVVKNEEENVEIGRELIEQGRTFVHHAVKRFMIILPAIFFKLGIAFTLLLIVTLVAVNNGFIGFLLLVVGMSSVLARLQEARRPPPVVPYIQSIPTAYHHHGWDRSDNQDGQQASKGVYDQQYAPSVGYYTRYVANAS